MSGQRLLKLLVGFVFLFAAHIQAQTFTSSETGKLIDRLKEDVAVSALEMVKAKKLAHPASTQLHQAETILDTARPRPD